VIESLQLLGTGIAFGTAGGLSPGPTLTLVVAQTLRFGFKEGLKVAISPLLTDAPIVVLALVVMARVDAAPLLASVSGLGAAFLLYLAYESFTAKLPEFSASDARPGSIRKGFLSNFFNPHPWVFWLTVGGPLMREALETTATGAALFLVGQYGCLVGAKILIAVLVAKGRGRLIAGYGLVMKLVALTLLVFALLFARQAFAYATLGAGAS
jgi:threonine/homoserine/homoserine lactone efflux protein